MLFKVIVVTDGKGLAATVERMGFEYVTVEPIKDAYDEMVKIQQAAFEEEDALSPKRGRPAGVKDRKPRRTKAQIEAARDKEATEAHQRASLWKDESMNTDAA